MIWTNEDDPNRAGEHLLMKQHWQVLNAANHFVRGSGTPYWSRPMQTWKGNHGVDIPLYLPWPRNDVPVGLVECKTPWTNDGNGRKALRAGLAQLMLDGRAVYPNLPLAIFFAASAFDFKRKAPILTGARTPDGDELELILREKLAALKVHLIVCARVGANYITDGGEKLFLHRVEMFAKRRRGRKRNSGDRYGPNSSPGQSPTDGDLNSRPRNGM